MSPRAKWAPQTEKLVSFVKTLYSPAVKYEEICYILYEEII